MKKMNYIILIFLFSIPSTEAQNHLSIDFDYARFKGTQSQINVEIYYSLYPSEWHLVKRADGRYEGSVTIEAFLFKNDSLIYRKAWKMDCQLDSAKHGLKKQAMVDLIRFSLPPGNYEAMLYADDIYSAAISDSSVIEFELNDFLNDSVSMSDVELCNSISKVSTEDVFTKNNLRVVPNPQKIFGQTNPIIFYYFELYNLMSGISGKHYQTELFVGDYEGNKIESVRSINKKKARTFDSSVEVGTVNVSSLSSGSYWLCCSIKNSTDATLIRDRKKFHIYNPQVDEKQKQKLTEEIDAVFAVLGEQEIDKELEYIQYLMTKQEQQDRKLMKKLAAKQKFLSSFWKKRDPDPKTVKNEIREDYLDRVRMADDEFTGFSKDGWQTDMGRVFILYGAPNDIERHPSSDQAKAYQIWTYEELQGGVKFIFIDILGFKNYQLVHSTYRGEIYNVNWQEFLMR